MALGYIPSRRRAPLELRSTDQQEKSRCSLAALGEHTTAGMFINLPYLQKHLCRGQHLHQSLPPWHLKEVPEPGGRGWGVAGRERVWLGQKVVKLIKVISIKQMWGEKLSFITSLCDIYTSTFFQKQRVSGNKVKVTSNHFCFSWHDTCLRKQFFWTHTQWLSWPWYKSLNLGSLSLEFVRIFFFISKNSKCLVPSHSLGLGEVQKADLVKFKRG